MKITEIPAKPKEQKITRVAAYARVSSDKDAAFHSLEAQTEYYEEYVAAHPDWELVSIYSDNGISGTIINRPEFQRMLEDCRAGKIDLVITKSITRFARNTVVLLETVRELKALGIDCYFEKENMHSISPDGELLLTLLAMYAEEEARSASENQKWRIKKLYDQGKPAGGHTYGYRLVDGVFVVVPGEAEVVKLIFRLFLTGMGYTKIARTLIDSGVPTYMGGTWATTTLKKLLQNEKYTGDMILQKYFRDDFRTKRLKKNTGELRKVFVHGCHEAIIDKDTFQAAQREIARRSKKYAMEVSTRTNASHHNDEKLFTSLIVCGDCGSVYVRKYTNAGRSDKAIWICHKYSKFGTSICHSQKIPEAIMIEKTKEVLSVDAVDHDLIREKIYRIFVPQHHHLIFELVDGSKKEVEWVYPSRSLSWTDEMKTLAKANALKRRRSRNDDTTN